MIQAMHPLTKTMTRHRFSLWVVLLAPFVVVLSLVVITLAHFNQKNVRQLVSVESINMLRSNNEHLAGMLRQYLEVPFQAQLTIAETLVQQGIYKADNLESVETYFKAMLSGALSRYFQQIEMIQLGTETGNFVGFQRIADGSLSLYLKDKRTGDDLYVMPRGGPTVDKKVPNYDPRLRPWYKPVAQSLEPQWSALYVSSTNAEWMAISAMSPLFQASAGAPRGSKAALVGVLSTDLSLTDLSRFLRETYLHKTFKSAVIYIVDSQGQLIAQSISGALVSPASGINKPTSLPAVESSDELVRESFTRTEEIGKAKDSDAFMLRANEQDYFGDFTAYKDPRGLNWRIVTLVSADELTGEAARNSRTALAIAGTLLLLGCLLGALIFHRISIPIRATARAAESLANSTNPIGNINLEPVPSNPVRETHQLTQAFNAMAFRISTQLHNLQDLALRDAVTGLFNINGLSRPTHGNASLPHTLVIIGVHNLSLVNASLGMQAGDQFLQAIAHRLSAAAPNNATLARSAGAKFVVLVPELDARSAHALVTRLLDCFDEPFVTATDDMVLQASAGLLTTTCTGAEIKTLALRKLSLALRHAAAHPDLPYVTYDDGLDNSVRALVKLRSELKTALDKNQLAVYFQPIVHLETKALHGMEALVRWPHSDGMIPPAEFIPVAEESGLIVALGNWIMLQSCTELVQWMAHHPVSDDFALHVNVSVRQLVQSDFVSVVSRALELSGLPAKHLTIEITESILMQESASTLSTIQALRALGAVIALDDFGTGYSSLSYLNHFPFHDIKIDRSFVVEAQTNEVSAAILRAVVDLTKGMRVAAIAEGIETEDQAALLRSLGCCFGQGYLFGRPAPLAQAMAPFIST